MHIIIERHIDAAVEQVWPLVAVPERMCAWSRAPIRSLAPGDGGHPGTTGALRAVEVRVARWPRVVTRLIEVIERGEPPHRVHYRVIPSYPIEAHRGTVELTTATGGGTDLRWEVRAEIGAGLDGMMSKRIESELGRSLDGLKDHVRAPEPLPVLAAIEPATDALWAAADAVLALQRERAVVLESSGDPCRWFARIYSLVTERLLERARAGEIVHPAWLLRLIPIFERYYAANLDAHQSGRLADLEPHWARAFRVAARDPSARGIGPGLFFGIRAHVEGDLGRSLAEVHARHYSHVDYVRFRSDYLTMGAIFRGAAEAMFEVVPRQAMPRWFRLLRRTLPAGLLDNVRNRSFYDMPAQRRRAFDDGARIARLLTSAEM